MLCGLTEIHSELEDHQLVTQAMRGSPYFKAFESEKVRYNFDCNYVHITAVLDEVRQWESQLRAIQSLLSEWNAMQQEFLAMEPVFKAENKDPEIETETEIFRVRSINRLRMCN